MSWKIPVILQIDVKWLWRKWEIVQVTPVYASNVLYPQKKAVPWDKTNLNNRQQGIEKKNHLFETRKQQLIEWKENIQSSWVTLVAQTTAQWKLYAKIDNKTLAKELELKFGFAVKSDSIQCDRFEQTWDYVIKFHEWDLKFSFDLHVVAK